MAEAGTGTINEAGEVTVRLAVTVDLHIVVPILARASDCRATPIRLDLVSTAPYDGERVTLEAANFTIPEVSDAQPCGDLIAPAVNDALAGAGHSLALTLAGDVTVPVAGEPTATSLAVTPAGGARVGQDVTLTATVRPDPAVLGAPALTGTVTFYDGTTVLGTAALDAAGTAALSTGTLPAGPRALRAAYSGAPPGWRPSSSAVTTYRVAAPPLVSTDLTGEVLVGGPGRDFTVTVANTGLGTTTDARLEVTIEATGGPFLSPPAALVLSRVAGDTATPVPLAASGWTRTGTIGEAGTWSLAPGAMRAEALRLEVPSGAAVGPIRITFTLVTVEEEQDVVLSSAVGEVLLHSGPRQPATLTAGDPGFVFPGDPPIVIIPPIPAVTSVVRQGAVAEVYNLRVEPNLGGVLPTGTVSFAVDGQPVPAIGAVDGSGAWRHEVPLRSSSSFMVQVPADAAPGARSVTATYSGDGLYGPSQASWPITIEPGVGTVYACWSQGVATWHFTATIDAQAVLDRWAPAGGEAEADRVEVQIRAARTTQHINILTGVTGFEATLGLSGGGSVALTTLSQSGASPMGDSTSPVDWRIDLGGGSGVVPVGVAPGETVELTVERLTISAFVSGFLTGLICTPIDGPEVVGSVTAVGTALAVEPGGPVRTGREVRLSAEVRPAGPGVVEFHDGGVTVGVAPVDGQGRASVVVSSLPAGTRSLAARFFSSSALPSSVSSPVELVVEDTACAPFARSGHGATVRLVYLELLGRCPDQAGFDHWVARLEGGASPGAFARSIARTPEAVGRVVDDAYRTMLDRPADAAGRRFWTDRLQRHGRYERLLADLAGSGEFWARAGGTDGGFVTRVYEQLLGRGPDASGLAYWTGRLGAGASPRAVVASLARLDEPLGVLVADSYGQLLDRAPSSGERAEAIAFLRATGDRVGLHAQLIGRPEFFTRAQSFPNP